MSQAPLVLVIEDDPDVSEGMTTVLEEDGYRVAAALDGDAGLRALRDRPDIDLVLLDLTLPKMSAAQFRQEQLRDPAIARVPVLLMSAGLDLRRQAEGMGVEYLAKPFKPPTLLAVVERILRKPAARSPA